MGARIEPCGTQQESLAGNEEKLPNLTEKLLFVKYDLNQLRTVPWMPTKYSSRDKSVFSSAFVINGRFEMGQKLLKLLASREGFLRRGVTVASLRLSGIVPETRHLFRNDTKLGPTESKICFKICGGRTS